MLFALGLMAAGIFVVAQTGIYQYFSKSQGLSQGPIASIALGAALVVLAVLSCVALCSGKTKCAILKYTLAVFYTSVGISCIVVGI